LILPNQDYADTRWQAVEVLSPEAESLPSRATAVFGALPFPQFLAAAKEFFLLVLLLPLVLFIHGYHPWSDDAAIYISGLRKMIQPSLYPRDDAFVLAHTKVSVFSHILASVASGLNLRLEPFLLIAWLISAFLFLYACRRFALRIFENDWISWIATLFAVACFTLPVAGTALFVMDPYLSARSFSTPLSILAVVSALDRRWMRVAFWIVLTAAMHPQMAIYVAGFIVVLVLIDYQRWRAALLLSIGAIVGCGAIWLVTLHAPVTAAYREAILSRTYFFPSLWQWYEWVGLAAPLLLLAVVWRRCGLTSPAAKISAACVLVGTAACVAAFAFVHPQGPYLLARVQLLRSFQLVYVLSLIMLGGFIGRLFLHRHRWATLTLFSVAALAMLATEIAMYPGSVHIEFPGSRLTNPWAQALVWIRDNTPADAVFAISPALLSSPAEDMPGFRARAERSVLVDNKDEGVASIFPAVAPAWKQRSQAEEGLDQMTPAERMTRLAPFGVSWLLLPPAVAQSLPCPYRNAAVAVCRMTQ
jgi:hypothetical protein